MDSSGKRIARTLLQIDVDLGMLRQECGQGSGLQPRDRARCRRKPRRDRHRRGRGQSRQRTSIQKRQFAGHHTTQARQIEALVEQPGLPAQESHTVDPMRLRRHVTGDRPSFHWRAEARRQVRAVSRLLCLH